MRRETNTKRGREGEREREFKGGKVRGGGREKRGRREAFVCGSENIDDPQSKAISKITEETTRDQKPSKTRFHFENPRRESKEGTP